MAKYCPIRKCKILYIECLECDDKQKCEKLKRKQKDDEKNETRNS